MKILIVEDSRDKKDQLINFLNKNNIEFEICEYLNDALRYIYEDSKNISGIILDLGLERDKSDPEYEQYMGLELVEETERIKLNIPILINSTTEVEMISTYSSVYADRTDMDDYDTLENFISFLRTREEQ